MSNQTNPVIDTDVEVRSFRIKDSRVHAHAPGLHGDPTGKWRIYYCPTLNSNHANVVSADSYEQAVVDARTLARMHADVDRRSLAGEF